MRIREEGVGDTWRSVGHTALWRHCRGANNPTLILYIKVIPKTAIQSLWLREVIVAKTQGQHYVTSYLPLILRIARPGRILELHSAPVQDRKLGGEAVGKTEEGRRQ